MDTEDFGPNEGDHGLQAEEDASISQAEDVIIEAQYRAVHDRIEDYTTWLIEMGYMAKNAVGQPMPGERSDYTEYLFELVEGYLDQVTEHEPYSALAQILNPDLMEGAGEPE